MWLFMSVVGMRVVLFDVFEMVVEGLENVLLWFFGKGDDYVVKFFICCVVFWLGYCVGNFEFCDEGLCWLWEFLIDELGIFMFWCIVLVELVELVLGGVWVNVVVYDGEDLLVCVE